ncbi:MAG: PAS domain S-box protein [Thermodesulfobacteriota bacterium]
MIQQTLPAVVIASVTFALGTYHLFVYDRDRGRRENLTFALTCFSMALYDVFWAGMASAQSVPEAMFWLRARYVGLASFGICYFYFIGDYTGIRRPKLQAGTALLLMALALFVVFDRDLHTLAFSGPFLGGFLLHGRPAAPGPIVILLGTVEFCIMVYSWWLSLAYFRKGDRRRARPLLVAVGIMLVAITNDGLVDLGISTSIHLFEYAFLGVVVLMGYSLAEDAVRASGMEESLRESERRYRLIAENARDVIWTANKDMSFTFLSPSIRHLTGYTAQETLSMPLARVLAPESFHRVAREMERLNAIYEKDPAGLPDGVSAELAYARKGGGEVWAEVQASVVRDAEGRPLEVVGITRDISARKKMEQELIKSEAHLRSVLTAARNVAFISTDLSDDPHITDFSPGAEVLLGYRREDVVGRRLATLVMGKDWEKLFVDGFFQKTDDGSGREAVMLARNRGVFPALLNFHPVHDPSGMRVGGLLVAMDIGRLKAAQKALKDSEERYRNILESIEEAYYEVDLRGNLTFFNSALCVISGYSAEELTGRNYRSFGGAETAREMFKVFNSIFLSGEPAEVSNFQLRTKDGSLRTVELSASLIRSHTGRPSGMRGLIRDVTERLAAEEERRNMNRRTEQAQKMEALGTLAGGVAHDFNNLLMGLQGNASLMLLGLSDDHPHYERLKNIEHYVQTAGALTRQLLNFARGGHFEIKTVDINAVIEKSASMFGRTRKDMNIHTALSEGVFAVNADANQMDQVLVNLLVNAGQAMPGGGDIYISTENVRLSPDLASQHSVEPGDYVKITVRDTGPGMDPEVEKRVFEPFFTTRERSRGTGLGLAIVYGIVQSHDGVITVRSEQGQGAVFTIFLPASASKVAGEQGESARPLRRGTETILMVDDEEMILQTGADMLTALGYRVITARGGKEAMRIFAESDGEVDLVLLDMIMPDLNGLATFEGLRDIRRDVRVLLCSGYALNEQAARIMQMGAEGFIQKPFTLEQISHKIREVLDAR